MDKAGCNRKVCKYNIVSSVITKQLNIRAEHSSLTSWGDHVFKVNIEEASVFNPLSPPTDKHSSIDQLHNKEVFSQSVSEVEHTLDQITVWTEGQFCLHIKKR